MTPEEIKRKREGEAIQARAKAEMSIFDQLSSRLRDELNSHPISPRPSVVLAALLRGVTEDQIIERLNRSRDNAENSDNT